MSTEKEKRMNNPSGTSKYAKKKEQQRQGRHRTVFENVAPVNGSREFAPRPNPAFRWENMSALEIRRRVKEPLKDNFATIANALPRRSSIFGWL